MTAFRSALALCALSLCALASQAQTTPAVSQIVAFYPSKPAGNLVRGTDGALYGTAVYTSRVSGGVIYRATIDGSSITTLYQVAPEQAIEPAGGLLLGSDKLLYGTTRYGSSTNSASAGTIFSISQTGANFTVLHRFDDQTTTVETVTGSTGTAVQVITVTNDDGAYPDAELIEGSDGLLYGTARVGGTGGSGTVFKVGRDGSNFQVLHTFSAATTDTVTNVKKNADGALPAGQLVQGADGFLYGVTANGGVNGRGTVYKVGADGTGFQVLHTFSATTQNTTTFLQENAEGATPVAGLTDGGDGFFYGVTSAGGKGYGTIFAVPADGSSFDVLYQFDGANGSSPLAEMTLGADGKLYGTTGSGGETSTGTASTLGVIFSIERNGANLTRLHSLDGSAGYSPASRLIEIAAGDLIGTTGLGGACGNGSIFRWSAAGTKYSGNTTCGVSNNNGGGAAGPGLLLLLGGLAWLRRRMR